MMKLKSEALRKKIIATATTLMIEDGIEGTSTVKVAKQLEMAQSNVYSYYKSREDLLLAVFTYHQQLMVASLMPLLDESAAPIQQFETLFSGLIQFAKVHYDSIRIIMLFRNQPNWRQKLPTINDDAFFIRAFKLLRDYQAAKIVKPVPVDFLVEGAFSIVVNYVTALHAGELTEDKLTVQDVISLIEDLMLV
ncbi:TetR/AcrR family transcriptional regulator [Secundilactobacillus paracollinoides]|uniref:TetR/AcrR family transcriptional regulator n=1 Tax=Secundilactobacillus paracollinoides TaxID=240427 RepID=UPI0006EF095E|nr:TetR/AcrR family transcriptional regulator [Secundilactobacillus paracollinoides]KRL81006.1 hypothetical protein FC17_GL002822 [Secundilactobacillus paracollinoides DSM 15502 = JCM 11969]